MAEIRAVTEIRAITVHTLYFKGSASRDILYICQLWTKCSAAVICFLQFMFTSDFPLMYYDIKAWYSHSLHVMGFLNYFSRLLSDEKF
jgi:hypothetical protein